MWRDTRAMSLSDALQQQIDGLRQALVGLGNIPDALEEHVFGSMQRLSLDIVKRAGEALGEPEAFARARTLIETFVRIAERDGRDLATELVDLAARMTAAGSVVDVHGPVTSKPLASFPTEPTVHHTVFVDEAGTAAWAEEDQPVLTLAGVLVDDAQIVPFDAQTSQLLQEFDVAPSNEIHTQPCLSGEGAYSALQPRERYELLKRFAQLGLRHSLGVHYLGMLKPFVREEFREKIDSLGLDAYTSNVLHFNVTLQVACMSKIGLAQYRYLFDRTDKYRRDIRQIIAALKVEPNDRLRIRAIAGDPEPVDSADHRFVQLADVAGYFLTRHRQLEIRTFRPREALLKHRDEILEMYELFRPKILDFVRDGVVLIDWPALQSWSHPRRRAKHRRRP